MDRTRRCLGVVAVLLGLATVLLGGSGPVLAHTGFESSSPAQGDVVADPVSSVVVVFTGDTQPVDDLLVVLDTTGAERTPTELSTSDQRTFTATFDPPLAGGEIGVRWTVLGADGHPLDGAFSFTVTADLTAATTVPAGPVSDAAPETVTSTTVAAAAPAEPSDDVTVDAAPSLDEFLTSESAIAGQGRRLVGRLLSIPAASAAIGALAFLLWALRGSSREIAAVVSATRVAGAVIAVGALVHYSGVVASTGAPFVTGWTDSPARAMGLRLVGGILLAIGLRAAAVSAQREAAFGVSRSLSAAVVDVPPARASGRVPSHAAARWDPAPSAVGLVGVALLVVSFWFDGHTVTRGWRPLHAAVNGVHVLAGGVWFGGVITLMAIAWWRHRRGDDVRIDHLVVRFSSIATVALVAVAVAGGILAVFVLDGFGQLTGTEWGRTLLLKTAAVTLAASVGAYNHFRLRPALAGAPGDPDLRATLRSTLTAEAILLTFVVVVTCWLVAAAT